MQSCIKTSTEVTKYYIYHGSSQKLLMEWQCVTSFKSVAKRSVMHSQTLECNTLAIGKKVLQNKTKTGAVL